MCKERTLVLTLTCSQYKTHLAYRYKIGARVGSNER